MCVQMIWKHGRFSFALFFELEQIIISHADKGKKNPIRKLRHKENDTLL